MGGGPKTTTTSTNTSSQAQQGSQYGTYTNTSGQTGQTQQQTQSTQTTNPNLPDWYSKFLAQIPGAYGSLFQQQQNLANRPLYGPQQQANFNNQVNRQTGQARQDILSQLASTGALNSTRAGEVLTGLDLGKIGQEANYAAQLPALNAQFQQGALGQLGNLVGNAANFRPPIGQTTTGNVLSNVLSQILSQSGGASGSQSQSSGTSSSDSTQTQQQSGGLLNSLLGGLLGSGLSLLTGGASSLLGGGGGANASPPPFNTATLQAPPNSPPPLYQPTSYGATPTNPLNQVFGNIPGPSWG